MTLRSPGNEPAPACPRCGYDQRGAIAQWTETCPLESICTECGLAIDWSELLSPRRQPPRWCIEYAFGLTRTLIAVPVTLSMLFAPWVFWKRMRIEQPIRWGRIALLLAAALLVLYVLFAFAQAQDASSSNWFRAFNVIAPGAAPPTDADRDAEYWHALLLPFSRFPKTIYGQSPLTMLFDQWIDRSRLLLVTAAVTLVCPVMFVVLPFSRRRAKVRWAHVFRIALYGWPLWLIHLGLTFIAVIMGYRLVGWSIGEGGFANVPMYYALALPAMLLIFWAMAIQRYLRMPHAWAVAGSMVLIGVLAGAFLVVSTGLHTSMLRWMFIW